MSTQDQQNDLAAQVDERYLTDILVELARVARIDGGSSWLADLSFKGPDDPKLVHYVQNNLRYKLDALGVQHITDVSNNQLLI